MNNRNLGLKKEIFSYIFMGDSKEGITITEVKGDYQVTFPPSLSSWNKLFSSKELAEERIVHLMRCIDLWASLGDVPFTEDDELDEEWQHFVVGESKMDIWH